MPVRSGLILPSFGLLLLAAAGGWLAGGSWLSILLVATGGALALALLALGGASDARNADAAKDQNRPLPLLSHPDFALLADSSAELVIGLIGSRVIFANRAARSVLGDHVVGTDVRLAIRHPAAADHLTGAVVPETPVDLSGFGRAGESWQLRALDLSDTYRLAILSNTAAIDAAETMRADFVANASHELRTPLASIIGAAETLEDGEVAADDAARARFTGIIGREGRRMQRLVDDLLSVSRIAADRHRAPTSEIDLAAIVRAAIDEIRGGGADRAADIVSGGTDAPLSLNGDAAQIAQLIHNLVGNAMKYGRAGTPVTVSLSADAGTARLSIADEGDGIAPQHLPRLTERFYRVDNVRSREKGGTGLGLSIVKHIVERHRGQLEITSTPGLGTTVTITLPRGR